MSLLTLSPPIPLRLYNLSCWSNPPFLIFDIWALWRSGLSARAPECQKVKMVGYTSSMALGPSNSSNLEELALKGLICLYRYHEFIIDTVSRLVHCFVRSLHSDIYRRVDNCVERWPSAVGADDAMVATVTQMIMQQQQKRISWRTGDDRCCRHDSSILTQRCSTRRSGFYTTPVTPPVLRLYTSRVINLAHPVSKTRHFGSHRRR